MKQLLYLLLAATIIAPGCKRTPTGSTPVPIPEVDGSYVGWGRPGGNGRNVRLEMAAADSGEWLGSITYSGQTTVIEVTNVSADEDSVNFQYTRGEAYRLLGVVSNVAVSLYVLEPSGQPAYYLNREANGYNLSGDWDGRMYSEGLGDENAATLFMDQQSALFSGEVRSDYAQFTLVGDISDGAIEANEYFFSGLTTGSFSGYEFRFNGSFAQQDSISGTWYVSADDYYDQGSFTFWRNF